jgi:putative membrane protein
MVARLRPERHPTVEGVLVRLIVRLLAGAVALAVAAALVEGISVGPGTTAERALTLLGVAVIFGLVNAVVRPVVRLFTLPLFVLTLGLFTFVVNALMLLLTAWIGEQLDLAFEVDGFVAALLGAVVVSVVSFVINLILPDKHERR